MFNYSTIQGMTKSFLSTPRYEYVVNTYFYCNARNITQRIYEVYPKCDWKQRFCINDTSCFAQMQTDLVVFDTFLEQRMGFGRSWNLPPISHNSAYITQNYANVMNLTVNDTIILEFYLPTYPSLAEALGIIKNGWDDKNRNIWIPLTIERIVSEEVVSGKSQYHNPIFVEYKYWTSILSKNIHPALQKELYKSPPNLDSFHFAPQIHFSLDDRIDVFRTKRFSKIRSYTINYASAIAYKLGYDQITQILPLIENLEKYEIIETYSNMGAILTCVLINFTAIILIHSLFMVNIESKSFHNGILRALGLKKLNLYILVIYEFLWYAIPGFTFGFIFGFLFYMMFGEILTRSFRIPFSNVITWDSFLWSLLSGVAISIASSIIPFFEVGKSNVLESIESQTRPKVSDVKYTMERANGDPRDYWKWVFMGLAFSIYAFFNCYFVPQALFHQYVEILTLIYLSSVLMIIVGLVWLSFLFENIFQYLTTQILFFFASEAMKMMIIKNLIAHKIRNRRSVLLYSLCIGIVIFISVTFGLQTMSFRGVSQQIYGSKFTILSQKVINTSNFQADLEGLVKNSPEISGYTFISHPLTSLMVTETTLSNLGRLRYTNTKVSAIPPKFYSVLSQDYLVVDKQRPSGFSSSESLYHWKGTNEALVGTRLQKSLGLGLNGRFMIHVGDKKYQFHPNTFIKNSPASLEFNVDNGADTLVSFPQFLKMLNGTYNRIQDVPISKFFLQFHSNITDTKRLEFQRKLISLLGVQNLVLIDSDLALETITKITEVFDAVSMIVIFLVMIICGFSFLSSMYLNIMDQSKEIGIMMSLGINRWFILRLFVYESFILILVSCVIGLAIGTLISYLITMQRSLFETIHVPFLFPWKIILVILPLILISSSFSMIPSCIVTGRPIVRNLYQRGS